MELKYKWEIVVDKKVYKSLDKIQEKDRNKILLSISLLSQDPIHGPNVKKLQGDINQYRLRVGDYRIIYELDFSIIRILIIRIAHRKEVYK